MPKGPLDAEERARLLAGLSATSLSQSTAALEALRADCDCRGDERPITCVDLLAIYTARMEHLRHYNGPYARELAVSVEEFVGNLEKSECSQAYFYRVQPPSDFEFVIFVSAENEKVLGCLKMLPKAAVSPERWDEIWGDGGPEGSGYELK